MDERHATKKAYEFTQSALWSMLQAQNHVRVTRNPMASAIGLIIIRALYGLMRTYRTYLKALDTLAEEQKAS